MNKFQRYSRCLAWSATLLLSALVAGCGGGGGGGRDPILGTGGGAALAPTVTSVVPLNNATGVAINNTLITATFSEPVASITGTASFTVTCAAPCVNPASTVSLNAAKTTATFTLAPGTSLFPNTLYTATVTGATSIATGLAMASPFVWHFTTGAAPDTTRPRVAFTIPATSSPGPTPGVATNTSISAVFTEEMAPATINGTSFTVTCAAPCVSPTGAVTYTAGAKTAVFTPQAPLAASTTYTATITTAATDIAGNALAGNQAPLPAASNYVWTFTTAAGAVTTPPTVTTVSPPDLSINVCLQTTISATFSEDMNAATINTATFKLQTSGPPLGAPLAGTVTYNALSKVATFTPSSALVANTNYTATVTTGVKDLAGNALATDKTWAFTTGTQACSLPPPNPLGSASPFGDLGGTAGTTNQGILTVINGDLGSTATNTSAVTGFHDLAGDIYTETGSNIGTVNGTIYTCTVSTLGPTSAAVNPAACAIATQARLDAQTAYNNLSPASLPGGTDPGAGQLGGLTLFPGIYQAAGGSFLITGSDLTLDGQGDANAVWVFQMASTLTVGAPAAPRSIILINGAQAKNVYWQVGTSATINGAGGGTMVGTIIASSAVSFSTAGNVQIVTLNGRAIGLNASVTMTNTVINVPGP